MIIRECFNMRQKPSVHRWELSRTSVHQPGFLASRKLRGCRRRSTGQLRIFTYVGSMGFCLKIAIRAITYVTKSSTDVHWFLDALYYHQLETFIVFTQLYCILYSLISFLGATPSISRRDDGCKSFLCLWIDIKKVESQPFTGTNWWVKLSKYQEY